jgi:hypothetical protein
MFSWSGPIGLGVFFGGPGVFWLGLRHLSEIRGQTWKARKKSEQ